MSSSSKRKSPEPQQKTGLSALLEAINQGTLRTTQGKSYATAKIHDIHNFILEKCKAGDRVSIFTYLADQSINSKPETTFKFVEELEARHGACLVGDGGKYPQVKIPCSDRPATEKDKFIGYIPVQRSAVEPLLLATSNSKEFIEALQMAVSGAQHSSQTHGAHLCKNPQCRETSHILRVNAIINIKHHEVCPSYWVINDKLHNFCCCTEQAKCIAPGGVFNRRLFSENISQFVNTIKSD